MGRGKKKLLFRGIATGTKSSASPCAKSTGIFFAAAHGIHGGTNLPAAPQARQDPQAQSKLFYQPHERSPAINCITWHTAHQGAYRKNLQKSRLDILNILYILFIYSKTKENPVQLSIDNRSDQPIYEQIAAQIKAQIISGRADGGYAPTLYPQPGEGLGASA